MDALDLTLAATSQRKEQSNKKYNHSKDTKHLADSCARQVLWMVMYVFDKGKTKAIMEALITVALQG